MLLGWLDHALLEVARLQRGPAALDAVVASRWAPAPAYASPWAQRLGELADQAHVELRVREAPAREVAGLQVADLLAHALGPGSLQALAPSAAMIAERTEAGLAAQVRRLLGPGLRYVEHDALLDHRLVNRATLAFLREAAFDRVAHEAQALPPARLPDGHFPASLQACAATVPALRGLWS